MIVLKFGGTSLESAEALERVAKIVSSRSSRRPVLVVSAMGKATDALLAMGRDAAEGRWHRATERLRSLEEDHSAVATALVGGEDRLELRRFLDAHFVELLHSLESISSDGSLSPKAQAAVTSMGERLSSGVVAIYLRSCGISAAHFDSRKVVHTDDSYVESKPLLNESCAEIRRALCSVSGDIVPVLGGFIGSTPDGTTSTLGRNSSNLTAVLVAAALEADEVEMWTDVDGVYRHDPRHVLDQSPVEELSFEEAARMASNGAKVFHHAAVMLAQQEGIPLRIKNSRNPEAPGTLVSARSLVATAPERMVPSYALATEME